MSSWLDVEVGLEDYDINALPPSVIMTDLYNDNDYKLVVGDLGKGENGPKLKVFKGTIQISELTLPDVPAAVVSFYNSQTHTSPFIAVALGTAVYIYKNMKLFYKYYLPSIDVCEKEIEAWDSMKNKAIKSSEVVGLIKELKMEPFSTLSWKSQELLLLKQDEQEKFVAENIATHLNKSSEISCMTSLNANSMEKFAVAYLVIGLENGEILFVETQTFMMVKKVNICDYKLTPYQIIAVGLYDVDYKLIVATREKSVCLISRELSEGKCIINTLTHIIHIDVMCNDHSIVVICNDKTMNCYNKKGKKQWTVIFEHYPITMTLMNISHIGTTLIAVAFKSGHIHIYNGKILCESLYVKGEVSVMKFGQLGQAEHVLIIITSGGDLLLKIMKRTAEFNMDGANSKQHGHIVGAICQQQTKPIVLPKKSKVFLEQAIRERENATAIHKTFQQDLNFLRLTVTNLLVDVHTKSENYIGIGNMDSIRLSAEVEGIGPVFRIILIIENIANERAIPNLALLFHVNSNHYKISRAYFPVPLLVPGTKIKFPTKIEELFTGETVNPDVLFRNITGQASERCSIKVLLLSKGMSTPTLAATIQMPATDPMMLPMDKIQTSVN